MIRKLLAALLLAFTLTGIARVSMDVEVLDMLPTHLPAVQGLRLFLQHFSQDDEIIITLEGSDPDALVTLHASLAQHLRNAQPDLGTCLSEPLWTGEPNQDLGELLAWLLINGTPEDAFASVTDRLLPEGRAAILEDSLDTIGSSMALDEALTLAYDPYQLLQQLRSREGDLFQGGDEFASADGSMRLLYLHAPPEADLNYRSRITWVNAVKTRTAAWQTLNDPENTLHLGFTGEPVFQAEIGSSMESDMKTSGVSALLLTSIIFAVAYRRLRPLLALMACLTATFLVTLGLAGWVLDSLTVMSVGFASILIGLTVDYGVILYQASLGSPCSPSTLRRRTGGSIVWAALTTAAAFAALGTSVVPGIATLGQLVALGILAGMGVMLWLFPLFAHTPSASSLPSTLASPLPNQVAFTLPRAILACLALLVTALTLSPLWLGFPKLDASTEALRPRHSPAYDTMDRLEAHFLDSAEAEPAILQLSSTPFAQIEKWQAALPQFSAHYHLPTSLLPQPQRQTANLHSLTASQLDAQTLTRAAEDAGFEAEAMSLTAAILHHWQAWQNEGIPLTPTSETARRIWSRLVALDQSGRPAYLLASITPKDEPGGADRLWKWLDREPDLFPVSWPYLSSELNHRIPADLRTVGLWLGAAVLLMLILALRRWQEVLLALAVTSVTLMALCGAMRWLGWQWNFFSLSALLLTFGAGLDYSMHILLHRRDPRSNHQTIVRALGVCSLSTVAGFASIAWASNAGLAGLGRVCALALILNALVALILLPWALQRLENKGFL